MSRFHFHALFSILLFLAFCAAVVGDNATESLLLEVYEAEFVSRMFFVNGGVLFLFSIFSMSLIDYFNRAKLYLLFLIIYWCAIILCRIGLSYEWSPLLLISYTLAYSGKIFMFFFVWTLANDMSDKSSAGTSFPLIAAGGSVGALLTTLLIPQLIKLFHPRDLLVAWSFPVMLSGMALILIIQNMGDHFIRRRVEKRIKLNPLQIFTHLSLLKNQPLLSRMSVIYFIIFVLIFYQQYLFFNVLRGRYPDAEEISLFLGYFNAVALSGTILFQTLIAGPLSKKFGSIRMITVLPAVLAIAYALIIFTSVSESLLFNAVIGGVALRIAVFDSFFSPNYQSLFTSLPENIRGKGKIVIDGVVKPVAMSTAALIVPLFSRYEVGVILLFILAIYAMFAAWNLRYAYISSALIFLTGKKQSSLSRVKRSKDFLSRGEEESLFDLLTGGASEVREAVVESLIESKDFRSVDLLIGIFPKLPEHTQSLIAREIVKSGNPRVKLFLRESLEGEYAPRVKANILFSLGESGDVSISDVRAYLDEESPRLCGNAIYLILKRDPNIEDVRKRLFNLLHSRREDYEATALWILTQLEHDEEFCLWLREFWYERASMILKNGRLWRGVAEASIAQEDEVILYECIDMWFAQSESNQRFLISIISKYLCQRGESLFFKIIENATVNRVLVFRVLVEALCISRISLSSKALKYIEKRAVEAHKLGRQAIADSDLFQSLGSPVGHLLSDAVLSDIEQTHFKTLLYCAAICDRSRVVFDLIFGIESGIYSGSRKLIEIIEALPLRCSNSELLEYIKNRDSVRNFGDREVALVINGYLSASSPIVRNCAHYLIASGEIDEK